MIPTLYRREGGTLFFQGSSASRMMKTLSQGIALCVCVTLVDGMVLARSAFNHSMNYRSVVAFGRAELLRAASEKFHGLRVISEHLLLDPFQDRQRGVLFQVNSLGVQADAAWSEGVGPDYSHDQVWDSDSALTSRGWITLIAIPFRSLRFSLNKLDWGIVLQRNLPRNSETDYWPRVTPGVSGVLSQEGTLRFSGMSGISHSHNLEITPYVLGQNIHSIDSVDPDNPYFSTRNAEATAGGEAKLILSNSIVIDGTINPDFSDVESDQPQFTVNQRYPVYFPELRPFFS